MLALMRAVPRGRRFVKATEPTGIAAYLWNQYGDPLIQAILEAIASTQGEISARKVQIALENGDIVGALSAIPWDEVGATRLGAALPATFESAIADAGSSAAAELGDVALSFSVTRGEIASWIQSESQSVIRYLTDSQRNGIQAVIDAVAERGLDARAAAELIVEGDLIGLTPRDVNAVFRQLQSALDGGASRSQADARAIEYTQRLMQQRAMNIARTELARTTTRGKLGAWSQAVDGGGIDPDSRKKWVVDGDPCPVCLALEGVTVGLFDTFPGGFNGPPDPHTCCMCDLELVGAAA